MASVPVNLGLEPPEPPGERTIPARAAWWGLAGVAVGFVLSGILQGVALLAFSGSGAAEILLGEVGLWSGFGGTCVLVSRRYGTGSLATDFGLAGRGVDPAYGLVALLGCFISAAVIGSIFVGTRFQGSNTNIITSQKGNTVGVAVVTVITAVGAPIFEELFFRGFLRRALSSRFGAVGAIWMQAGCFGVAHYQFALGLGNVSIVLVTAGLGVVLGYTAHFTGRLGPGILAHGLFNLYVTLSIIGLIGVQL